MAVSPLQNFYKESIKTACGAGAENIYVTTKPVPINGFLVISPGSESLREIIKYTGTGTDGDGDYVTVLNVSDRGLGGTTAQAHEVGEPIRMNYTAEHQKEIDDTIEAIVAAGAPNASTSVTGLSRLSSAPVDPAIPIAVGTNDARMNATTGLTADEEAALAGGGDFGTPSASNKFVTEEWNIANSVDLQEFTDNGTWTKPTIGKMALVEIWGAGGGGGAGLRSGTPYGASGGGGGAHNFKWFKLSDLPATVAVTRGEGGAGGVTSGQLGVVGGTTTFGTLLSAFGGGGGRREFSGGAGGGIASAGALGAGTANSQGGQPTYPVATAGATILNTFDNLSFGGAHGQYDGNGGNSIYGGGAGGASRFASFLGGSSMYAGGGGGGAGRGSGGSSDSGGAGGNHGSFSVGGGGAGGESSVDGADGSSFGVGGGGGGSASTGSTSAGKGGNGGICAGGGGGGGADSDNTSGAHGAGGNGGNGFVRVTVF